MSEVDTAEAVILKVSDSPPTTPPMELDHTIESESRTPPFQSKHTGTLPNPAIPSSAGVDSDTAMPNAGNGHSLEPTPSSSAEKPGRANRKGKRFVATAKDPHAPVQSTPSKARERAAEDTAAGAGGRPRKRRLKPRLEEAVDIPYQTIKAINMPPRAGGANDQNRIPSAPVEGTFPYGNTEDYKSSMIIYWLDEEEHTYGTTTTLFNNAFPDDKITDNAIRRRHIRALQRLLKRYGAKPIDQIGPVGKNVLRRKKARAPKLRDIVPEFDQTAAATQSEEHGDVSASLSTSKISATPELPLTPLTIPSDAHGIKSKAQKSREFEKACIVVWRDAEKMDFKAIRDRLENERNLSLGLKTVEKYYDQALDRVHGNLGVDGEEGEEGEEGGADGHEEGIMASGEVRDH